MVVLDNYPALDFKYAKVTCFAKLSSCGFKEHEGDMVVLNKYPALDLKKTKVTWS